MEEYKQNIKWLYEQYEYHQAKAMLLKKMGMIDTKEYRNELQCRHYYLRKIADTTRTFFHINTTTILEYYKILNTEMKYDKNK